MSCVVPVFNGGRYLSQALDSILGQTYSPKEVIVADDGSTDATLEIVAGYGDEVQLVSQETQGPSATRNLGLRAAKGEFVAFLDADDLWRPEKLARQMARYEARPELDLSVTYAKLFWDGALATEADRLHDHPRAQAVPGYATTTLLARRTSFAKVGEFNTRLWFADSVEWFMRAFEQQLVLELLPEVLVDHRMHATNLTRRRAGASREEFLHVIKGSLDRRRRARAQLETSHPGT